MVIFKEKILLIFLILSLLFLLISAAFIFFNAEKLSSPLILHFDSYRGVDRMGEIADLWLILILGLLAAIINSVLAEVFFYRERILAYLLSGTNVFIGLLVLIAVTVIISVN